LHLETRDYRISGRRLPARHAIYACLPQSGFMIWSGVLEHASR